MVAKPQITVLKSSLDLLSTTIPFTYAENIDWDDFKLAV